MSSLPMLRRCFTMQWLGLDEEERDWLIQQDSPQRIQPVYGCENEWVIWANGNGKALISVKQFTGA